MSIQAVIDSITAARVPTDKDSYELFRRNVHVPSGDGNGRVRLSILDVQTCSEPVNTLLLLHGFAANSYWWRQQLPALARRNRVIVIDARGNGHSQHADSGYTVEQLADDAAAVLNECGVTGPVIVAGHSTGGFVATEFAVRYSQRTDRVILVATPATFSGNATIRTANLVMMLPELFFRIGQPLYELDPRGQASLLGLKRLFRNSLLKWDGSSKFPQVTRPALVIYGQRDVLFPGDAYTRVVDLLPDAEAVNIGVSKHQVTLERPHATLRAMLRFIDPAEQLRADWRTPAESTASVHLLPTRPWLVRYEGNQEPDVLRARVPVARLLAYTAEHSGGRTAVQYGRQTFTYRALDQESNRFAQALLAQGITAGDRVLIRLPNLPHLPVAFFGTLKLGATAVLLDPGASPATFDVVARRTGARACVLPEPEAAVAESSRIPTRIYTSLEDYAPETLRVRRRIAYSGRGDNHLPPLEMAGGLRWSPLLTAADPLAPEAPDDRSGSATAVILAHNADGHLATFSSANLIAATLQLDAWFDHLQVGRERILTTLPFCHAFGLSYGLLLAVQKAACMVLSDALDIDSILEQLPRMKPTLMIGRANDYRQMMRRPTLGRQMPDPRPLCVTSGEALSVDDAEAFIRLTRAPLMEVYGLGDCLHVAFANPVDRIRLGAAGVPLPDTEVRLVDVDAGQPRPLTEVGEIWLRGPQIAATAVDDDGWLHTGDLGAMDPEGYFHLMGSLDDVWRAPDGTRVYLRDVVEVLDEIAEVDDVAVVGRDDGLTGYVTLQHGRAIDSAGLLGYCRRRLPASHVPHQIHILDSLPRDAGGTLDRSALTP